MTIRTSRFRHFGGLGPSAKLPRVVPDRARSLGGHAATRRRAGLSMPAAGGSCDAVDDAEQRTLNAEWRDKDTSTNVLSFPQIEPFGAVTGMLGDISLARETVEREAEELQKPFSEHLTHLVVHGFLHILGYDHVSDDEAHQMERLETDILASLEIADPYADDSGRT